MTYVVRTGTPSRCPLSTAIDIGAMADREYRDNSLLGVDAVHDPVVAEVRAVFASEFEVKRVADALGVLAERPVDELHGRDRCFLREFR